MNKNSFILYKSFYPPISFLTLEQKGKLFDAIFRYQIDGIEDVDEDIKIPFLFFVNQFKIDNSKYENLCLKRSEAGKNGGAPKGNKNAQKNKQNKQNNQMVEKQTKQPNDLETNKTSLNDNDNDNDNEVTNVTIKKKNNTKKENTEKSEALIKFEEWLNLNCLYIYQNYKLLSDVEFSKLKTQYGSKAIAETCQQIENRKDLRKKYSNLYRTLLNWLKKDYGIIESNKAESRANEAADIIRRLAQKNKPVGI